MASGDLTTLSDVKAWLQTGQNAFPTTDDALLTRLITAVSQYIQTWLNRRLAMTDYLEVRDGTGGYKLQFACFPVVGVLSLTIDGQPVPGAPSTLAAGYSFSSTQLSVRGYRFNRGIQNIAVIYTAGYPTTPPEIAQACIELVSLRYRERTRIGEVSRSLGGAETVSYSQKDLSEAIKALLRQYRLVAPVSATLTAVASTGTEAALVSGIL
jgi:Phage gp6-like head-tail connector protein